MSTPMERLRQLVGTNNWDYCVLWKLSEDQSALVEQGQMSNSINNNHSFSMNMNIITELQSDAPISDINDQSQAALSTLAPAFETLNISSDSTNNNHQSMSVIEQSENGVHQTEDKQKGDQLDDNDEPQSKNFEAERKRREKLTEQLFILRSLVPNISKLDKASIIGDAITYIEELQKEARDLQDELERNFDDEYTSHSIMTDHHQSFSTEISNVNDCHDQAQQMEVQVEVGQLERNNFYVKVFGEQARGGFVRLMEALNCLGLEIIKVNMTNCISLVSYDFIVKKRDNQNVPTEYLRDSLLEATRSDQTRFRSEMRNRRKLVPESNTC